jgi:hypothetical protein
LIAAIDPARASQALLSTAFRAWWADVPIALRDRMIAQTRALPPGTPEVIVVMTLALVAPAEHGPEIRAWIASADPDEIPAEMLRLFSVLCAIVGAFDRGVVVGDRALERLRARGRYGLLATALVGRAWAGVFAGSWSASLAAAQQAQTVSRETNQPLWVVAGLSAEAALSGVRGDLERALRLADRSEQALPPGAADGMRSTAEAARGLAQLTAGEPSAALAHLRRVLDPGEPWHSGFVARWVVADAVEAAVLANAYDEARAITDRAAAFAPGSGALAAGAADRPARGGRPVQP